MVRRLRAIRAPKDRKKKNSFLSELSMPDYPQTHLLVSLLKSRAVKLTTFFVITLTGALGFAKTNRNFKRSNTPPDIIFPVKGNHIWAGTDLFDYRLGSPKTLPVTSKNKHYVIKTPEKREPLNMTKAELESSIHFANLFKYIPDAPGRIRQVDNVKFSGARIEGTQLRLIIDYYLHAYGLFNGEIPAIRGVFTSNIFNLNTNKRVLTDNYPYPHDTGYMPQTMVYLNKLASPSYSFFVSKIKPKYSEGQKQITTLIDWRKAIFKMGNKTGFVFNDNFVQIYKMGYISNITKKERPLFLFVDIYNRVTMVGFEDDNLPSFVSGTVLPAIEGKYDIGIAILKDKKGKNTFRFIFYNEESGEGFSMDANPSTGKSTSMQQVEIK